MLSNYLRIIFIFIKYMSLNLLGDWGWGMGDGVWGIGDCAHSPIPNPQSPIPNPQSPIPILNFNSKYIFS